MLIRFFLALRDQHLKVSLKELFDLLLILEKGSFYYDVEDFYRLSKTVLIKDETLFDRFDELFARFFSGISQVDVASLFEAIPEEWVRKQIQKHLTDEEKQAMSSKGFEALLKQFQQRLKEQQKRHQGGNRWIGTGGTSPFGAWGYHPEGVRVGGESIHKKAFKVWEQRQFADLDSEQVITRRQMNLALRKLRRFARSGHEQEFDLDETISATAHEGWLQVVTRPTRENSVQLLVLFDIGGSMDPYIHLCEELFSAVRQEFKHLKYYYFHNFIYDHVWKNHFRRQTEKISTWDLLHTYPSSYKVILVGDASMSPYEIHQIGGNIEHWNDESGATWAQRLHQHFRKLIWLNPIPKAHWAYTPSINMTRELFSDAMFELSLSGLTEGIQQLKA